MSDEELDAAIAERFKAYEAGIRLPGEFKDRFVGSVRRRRVWRRVWMLGLFCAMAAACGTIAHFGGDGAGRGHAVPAMSAASASTNETTKVSCLVLVGYLHEWLGRSKSPQRKEEE